MRSNERAQAYVVVAALVAIVTVGVGFALLRGRSAGTATIGTAGFPKQGAPAKGQPFGQARLGLIGQRADFVVPVPPPPSPEELRDLIQRGLALQEVFPGDWNLNVFPAQVTTLRTKAADGARAPFEDLGGIAVVGGVAYVGTASAVLSVDLTDGSVRVLSGEPNRTGCVMGADPSAVRFRGPAGDVVSDGRDLFIANGCGISKVSPSTGSASLLEPWSGPMAMGPDGHLYAGALEHGQPAVMRIDPAGGAVTRYFPLSQGSYVLGLAADSRYLWATVDEGPSSPVVIDRVGFADGSIARYLGPAVDLAGDGQILSAGNYLYLPTVGNLGLLQFTKVNGGWGLAVGGTKGDTDGPRSSGSFEQLTAIASDGQDLWVIDAGNAQIRKVAYVQMFPGVLVGP